MSVEEVLKSREADLPGRLITSQEAEELTARLGADLLPACLLEWLRSYPLVETEFSLAEEEDESELGVEMQWLTPTQTISEMIEAWPAWRPDSPVTWPWDRASSVREIITI